MLKNIKYKFGFLTYYIIVAIFLEIAMFISLDIGLFPKYWLYDFSIILMIAGLIFIIPNYVIQAIFTAIMLGIQVLLFYLNFTLYSLYGDIFSLDMITLFKEAAKAVTSDFTYIWLIVALVVVYISIIIGIVFIAKRRKRYPISFKKNFTVAVVMVLCIIQGFASSIYVSERNNIKSTKNIVEAGQVSDSFLMDTSMLKLASLKTFGLFGYYTNNLLNTVWNTNTNNELLDAAINYFNNADVHDEEDSELFGVDEGNNVIMIMVESLEWFALCDGTFNSRILSDELTPNIYSLIQDGFIATDFFAKSNTNISEGIGFIGSYPIGKYMEQVTKNSDASQYDFTLPNILSDHGYSTAYFHTNESTYYERNKTHTKLGFDNIYCWDYEEFGYDGGFKWGNWIKEEDFVYSAMDYMIPEKANKSVYGEDAEKFFTFYTTVSSHGPYDNNSNNADQVEYKDYVMYGETCELEDEDKVKTEWYENVCEAYEDKGEEFINRLVNYQATIVGLDRAIGALIDKLKEYEIYDDTTIIIYSDHNAYYHNLSNDIKEVEVADYMDIDLNTIPLIIKSNGIFNYTNEDGDRLVSTDRFCSAYDLLPTVLDLLGIKFNKRLYIGNSLFTSIPDVYINEMGQAEEIIIYYSLTGGLISQEVYTLDMTRFYYTDFVTVGYLDKFKEVANETLRKLNYIYTLYVYGTYHYVIPI